MQRDHNAEQYRLIIEMMLGNINDTDFLENIYYIVKCYIDQNKEDENMEDTITTTNESSTDTVSKETIRAFLAEYREHAQNRLARLGQIMELTAQEQVRACDLDDNYDADIPASFLEAFAYEVNQVTDVIYDMLQDFRLANGIDP